MGGPTYWGVAGSPISHSLTPKLFQIMAKITGVEEAEQAFLQASDMDQFINEVSKMDGELWLSCTSPLKHLATSRLGVSGPEGVSAVNQLRRSGGKWYGANTDGIGFLIACRNIGIEPSRSTLMIRGGGSTARSIAAAWSLEGGSIIPVLGRRKLLRGPWDSSILDSGEADISVDLDAEPAGEESFDMESTNQVSITYGLDSHSGEFAIMMLVAQHIEAWRALFAPEISSELPSLDQVLTLI